MYKNQYILTDQPVMEPLPGLVFRQYEELSLYFHHSLEITYSTTDDHSLILMGYLIDPWNPGDDNQLILEKICRRVKNKDDLIRIADEYSGRFIIIYRDTLETIAVGDTCHLRRIYYGFSPHFCICSSEKLYNDFFQNERECSTEKQFFLNSAEFQKIKLWYGSETLDDRLKRLPPNFYLDIKRQLATRLYHKLPDKLTYYDTLEYTRQVLSGTYQSITRHFNLLQAMTGGLDSRILLSISMPYKDKIHYYIYNHSTVKSGDVDTAEKLQQRFDLNFNVVSAGNPSFDFKNKVLQFDDFPVSEFMLASLETINRDYSDGKWISINGNVTEIARCVYGYMKRTPTLADFMQFSWYDPKNPFVYDQLKLWYDEAVDYSREMNIPLLDLYYWEQRLGNWMANNVHIQDYVMEECSPFNNRKLIFHLLNLPVKYRLYPDFKFYYDLVKYINPECLIIPVNPRKKIMQEWMRRYTEIWLFIKRAKQIMR